MTDQLTRYRVAGVHPAYDALPGDEVELDASDPGVQLNVSSGVLELAGDDEPAAAEKITCPACAERKKRAPKFAGREELEAHYAKEHPTLVVPTEES